MSPVSASPVTVDFMSRFTASEQFDKVFREGMGLVEETANYLDGPGRQDNSYCYPHCADKNQCCRKRVQEMAALPDVHGDYQIGTFESRTDEP